MIRKLNILILAAVCLSCQTVVEIDVPHEENQLVVNSFFHPDSTFGISLKQSQFVLERGDFKIVTGATAILMDGEGNEIGQLNDQGSGIYTSDIKPQPGKSYRIKVSKKPFTTVTATGSVPEDTARITKVDVEQRKRGVSISIWLDDSAGEDYYELYGISKSVVYTPEDTIRSEDLMSFHSDDQTFEHFDGNSQRYLFFDDVLFDGHETRFNLDSAFGGVGCVDDVNTDCQEKQKTTLYLRKVSKTYYQYKETKELQDQLGGNPFAEPVPVYENIENGLGIFAGFQESAYTIEIPEYQGD